MLWTPGGRSSNLEDRRSMGGGMGRGLGIGGTVVVLALSLLFGRNLFNDIGVQPGVATTGTPMSAADSAAEETEVQFISFVLDDVQNTWAKTLPNYGAQFHPAKLVLFRNSTTSGCGGAQAAMGPFYCPLDERVYLDLGFFDELQQRFGAPGDFARAYVIAHELGHHVQKLTGIESRQRNLQRSAPGEQNAASVRMELQADCFAGVWGHAASQPGRAAQGKVELEAGDVEQGLNAAAAIGDDRLQRMATGRVMPDRFTHGSSAQRVEWFRRGLESGSPEACNTFGRETF